MLLRLTENKKLYYLGLSAVQLVMIYSSLVLFGHDPICAYVIMVLFGLGLGIIWTLFIWTWTAQLTS